MTNSGADTTEEYSEAHNDEIIALEAIYFNEFQMLSESPYYKFEISIKYQLQENVSPESIAEQIGELPFLVLRFEYKERYPDEIPYIEIAKSKNLPDQEVDRILENLNETATQNIGTVMIYNLICAAQQMINDYVDCLLQKQQSNDPNNAEDGANEGENGDKNESKRFTGTRVTVETFEEWRKKFELELLVQKNIQFDIEKERKLTGRELFEKNVSLNVSDLAFMDDETNIGAVDESLFCTLDDNDGIGDDEKF